VSDRAVERHGRSGPSARVGAMGEGRELLMALALNRAKVASQREIAHNHLTTVSRFEFSEDEICPCMAD